MYVGVRVCVRAHVCVCECVCVCVCLSSFTMKGGVNIFYTFLNNFGDLPPSQH